MDNCIQKTAKHSTVEILLDTASSKFNFVQKGQDYDKLMKGEIYAMACHAVANVSKTPIGKVAVAADVTRNGGFLKMVNKESKTEIERLPLSMLNPDKMNGKFFEFEPRQFSLTDFEIEFPDTGVITIGQALIFSFLYR